MPDVRRREVIALLGGAGAWPLAARAQQQAAMPVIGFLDPEQLPLGNAFRQGCERGWLIESGSISN